MPKEGKIETNVDDKKASSTYTVLESVPSKKYDCLNLVKLFPKTGRKHQLRIHLATIGNPILGDAEYGIEGLIVKGKGLYLHAYSLSFIHPFTNEKMNVMKDLPTKYSKIFSSLL